MTESSFAKQLLSALDSRPVVISSDHVEDPRKYPARPAYTLPKMPHPMKKRKRLDPGQEASVDVTMKSLRNPPLDITLSGQPLSTSILNLKTAISEKFGIPIDKIRLLLKKKPCPDSKTIKDLVSEGEGEVELSIMIIGGQTVTMSERDGGPASGSSGTPAAQGTGGGIQLDSEFWHDLKDFLCRRLKNEAGAETVHGVFKNAWDRPNAMQK
ncbi:hypothetical protein FGG08_007323 [Glutinoglossum americanum]|uniref:Ubiquitin-like domain-containing protein n=1 Tax=Glutinoglossum americanum TaxID=1670608 RepID=A0A9P8HWJ7_9PEZI|nr:hypothetical protein FGG08_007323 [Glutinoglossum americanum]